MWKRIFFCCGNIYSFSGFVARVTEVKCIRKHFTMSTTWEKGLYQLSEATADVESSLSLSQVATPSWSERCSSTVELDDRQRQIDMKEKWKNRVVSDTCQKKDVHSCYKEWVEKSETMSFSFQIIKFRVWKN